MKIIGEFEIINYGPFVSGPDEFYLHLITHHEGQGWYLNTIAAGDMVQLIGSKSRVVVLSNLIEENYEDTIQNISDDPPRGT